MLGKGKEYFGFANNPLQINAPAVWLPYTVLDRLMMELDANSSDSTYKTVSYVFLFSCLFADNYILSYLQLLDDMKDKLNAYFQTAERVSRSFVELSMS